MGTDAKSTVISFDMNRPLLHGARDIQLVRQCFGHKTLGTVPPACRHSEKETDR